MILPVTGPNASGKTQRMEQMRRRPTSERLRYIAFSDAYGPAIDGTYYLQQRWNQHDIDPEMPSVGDVLWRSFLATGPDCPQRRERLDTLCRLFGLQQMKDRRVVSLSSGELRKMQLTKALMAEPDTLVLDNPYIGLDDSTRSSLAMLLEQVSRQMGMKVLLVEPSVGAEPCGPSLLPPMPGGVDMPPVSGRQVIEMRHINIMYEGHTILSLPQWQVEEGQRWAIQGPNGSGKSTLLSLVCGDNPQAYACDIRLFGQPRGSGETIWQLKRRIGYVSPEMHRAYRRNLPAIHVVASGLKDTVGLYVRPTESERLLCKAWMDHLRIGHLAERPFMQMSSGEQRLVLLARAFVKDPMLLVLDEPMHGLDESNCQWVKDVICQWAGRKDRTLLMVSHHEADFPPLVDHRLRLEKQN